MNWAQNDRVRVVFVDKVKILEHNPFAQNRNFRRFGRHFDFRAIDPILRYCPNCFLLPNDYFCSSFFNSLNCGRKIPPDDSIKESNTIKIVKKKIDITFFMSEDIQDKSFDDYR